MELPTVGTSLTGALSGNRTLGDRLEGEHVTTTPTALVNNELVKINPIIINKNKLVTLLK